jgi:hypothetical protein
MTDRAQTDASKPLSRNRVMAGSSLAVVVVVGALLIARLAGVIPAPQEMSALGAIVTCVLGAASVVGFSAWYFARTDEHDLHANLWAMAWSWIASGVGTSCWVVLHAAGLAPVPDAVVILLGSSVVALATWVWLRFR